MCLGKPGSVFYFTLWLNIFFSLLNISVLTQFLKSFLLEVDTGSPGFRVMLALGSQGV